AALHLEADIAQFLQRNAWNIVVERLAEHMLALLRHALAAAAQHRIRRRRAIAADDPDIFARTGGTIRLPDEIEQARVHLDWLVTTPGAQDMIDLLQAG